MIIILTLEIQKFELPSSVKSSHWINYGICAQYWLCNRQYVLHNQCYGFPNLQYVFTTISIDCTTNINVCVTDTMGNGKYSMSCGSDNMGR